MIYKLLDIKSNSIKILLILFPPIYSLWLLALGKRALGKMNISDTFFSIITIVFFLLNLGLIIIWPFINLDFFNSHQNEVYLIAQVYFLIFLISLIIFTFSTIRFERLQNPERYYSFSDFGDYVLRFFSFFFWPIFIWTFQKTVNKYNKN